MSVLCNIGMILILKITKRDLINALYAYKNMKRGCA